MTPDPAPLLQALSRIAETPEAILEALGELERLKVVLWARLLNAQPDWRSQPEALMEEDRLLTIPEVADLLAIPKGYGYELVRRGDISAVRFGRYVRVPASALRKWMVRNQKSGLDKLLYHRYNSYDDRRTASAASGTTRGHPGSTRRAARRLAQHRGQVGTRRTDNSRAGSPPRPTLGEDEA